VQGDEWFLPQCLSLSLTGLADGLAPKGSATRTTAAIRPGWDLGPPIPADMWRGLSEKVGKR